MRTAPPDTLSIDVRPALTAHVPESDFQRLFPVQFEDVDVLAAAEPSKAALLRLDSGKLVVIEYGTVTSTLTVSVPLDANTGETLVELMLEASLGESNIEWLSDDVGISSTALQDKMFDRIFGGGANDQLAGSGALKSTDQGPKSGPSVKRGARHS